MARTKFYHASIDPLPVGTTLEPKGLNMADSEVEELLERHRPASARARERSVFMVSGLRHIESLCIKPDLVYRVVPTGRPSAHDHQWANAVWRTLAQLEADEIGKDVADARIDRFARAYWTGEPSAFRYEPPLFEFLADAAVVASTVDPRTGEDMDPSAIDLRR